MLFYQVNWHLYVFLWLFELIIQRQMEKKMIKNKNLDTLKEIIIKKEIN